MLWRTAATANAQRRVTWPASRIVFRRSRCADVTPWCLAKRDPHLAPDAVNMLSLNQVRPQAILPSLRGARRDVAHMGIAMLFEGFSCQSGARSAARRRRAQGHTQ